MSTNYLDLEAARRDIVEAGARMYRFRLVVGMEGNLSARVGENRVLATPAGTCKGTLRPEDLALVDLQGKPLSSARPSTELAMHLAIYQTRPELRAVVHGHPPYATAFAAAGRDLDLCLLPEAIVSLGVVPVSRYATPSTEQVGEAVREVIAHHDAFLLRNHGAVATGHDVMDAYYKLETVDQVARVTLLAGLLGGGRPLTRHQVDELNAIRGVYGLAAAEPPTCVTAEEARGLAAQAGSSHAVAVPGRVSGDPARLGDPGAAGAEEARLARIIAEEIARALDPS